MSRRCDSSKPTPTPLNGKATKPAKYVKKKKRKEDVALRGRKKSSTKNHCHVTRDEGGARKMQGKVKSDYKKYEKKK